MSVAAFLLSECLMQFEVDKYWGLNDNLIFLCAFLEND